MKKCLKGIKKMYQSINTYCDCIHLVRNDETYVLESRLEQPIFLEQYGYKVYSQNDEDGIITEIFNRIGILNSTFIEFGVQDGLEDNTHFLLHKGWRGLWIEGNKKSYKKIMKNFEIPIKNNKLFVLNAFINKDNINTLIAQSGIEGAIDLLSIDIDGNDYYVWEAITSVDPRVVIIEYNAKFPPEFEWIMKYDEKHIWNNDDEQGASLKALELLGENKGYQLVGTNSTGSNAFFVKKVLASDLFPKPATAENLYNPFRARYRKYVSGHPSRKYIGI